LNGPGWVLRYVLWVLGAGEQRALVAHATGNLDCLLCAQAAEKGLMRRVPTPAALSAADFSHNDRVSPFGVEIPTRGVASQIEKFTKTCVTPDAL
jgi:hypothetical protein